MRKKLEEVLRTHNLLDQYERNARVGDNRFQIRFPFVKVGPQGKPAVKAIKLLNLDKDEPTDIFRHADAWLSSVRRLRQYKTAPNHLLFVLRKPSRNLTSIPTLTARSSPTSRLMRDIDISDDHDESRAPIFKDCR